MATEKRGYATTLISGIPALGFPTLGDLVTASGTATVGILSGGFETSVATSGVVPLPAALPLFATGLGALGLLGWRRKRKARTVAA